MGSRSYRLGEYWIVNLRADCVEVHRDPRVNDWDRVVTVFRRGERIELMSLPAAAVAVDDPLAPPVS